MKRTDMICIEPNEKFSGISYNFKVSKAGLNESMKEMM